MINVSFRFWPLTYFSRTAAVEIMIMSMVRVWREYDMSMVRVWWEYGLVVLLS